MHKLDIILIISSETYSRLYALLHHDWTVNIFHTSCLCSKTDNLWCHFVKV